MFAPVGPKPAAVYWRRRGALLLAVLIIGYLGYNLLGGGGSGKASGAPSGPVHSSTPAASTAHTPPPTTTPPTTTLTPSAAVDATTAVSSPTAHPSTHHAVVLKPCQDAALSLAAGTGATQYTVGSQPLVYLQVTNPGSAACVANVSDSRVELQIYNGTSRVWGSHDCHVSPGVTRQTIPSGRSIRVSITWSGLSSQPGCSARQAVGAGSYTLYGTLGGRVGAAAQFSIH
jgi:hypothetical protein